MVEIADGGLWRESFSDAPWFLLEGGEFTQWSWDGKKTRESFEIQGRSTEREGAIDTNESGASSPRRENIGGIPDTRVRKECDRNNWGLDPELYGRRSWGTPYCEVWRSGTGRREFLRSDVDLKTGVGKKGKLRWVVSVKRKEGGGTVALTRCRDQEGLSQNNGEKRIEEYDWPIDGGGRWELSFTTSESRGGGARRRGVKMVKKR